MITDSYIRTFWDHSPYAKKKKYLALNDKVSTEWRNSTPDLLITHGARCTS